MTAQEPRGGLNYRLVRLMAAGCVAESLLVVFATALQTAGLVALLAGAVLGVLLRPAAREWQAAVGTRGPLFGWGFVLVLMMLPAEVHAPVRVVRILLLTALALALGDLPGARLRSWLKRQFAARPAGAH